MRGGRLDRRILLQRKSVSHSGSGEPLETWATLAERSASISPVRGEERFGGDQWIAKEQSEFRIRYSVSVADLSPLDRIIYPIPAGSPGDAVDTQLYDVLAVHEIGRREGLRIIAVRRADTA
jgi:head-tail adaptor